LRHQRHEHPAPKVEGARASGGSYAEIDPRPTSERAESCDDQRGVRLDDLRSAASRSCRRDGSNPAARLFSGPIMIAVGVADLDELVTRCRADSARKSFGEAVACYRAGAYRAAIVATWSAVVFDYLGKLHELELSGNGEAKLILAQYERARVENDVEASLRLERTILNEATQTFELLTPIEKEDLERLRTDRHRCAHPSLLTLDEPYQPSAELARTHLRNAVDHLLSRPPLQGREAFEAVWRDVASEFFPDDPQRAMQRLQAKMSRARTVLVNKLVVDLTKSLLTTADKPHHARRTAALLAIIQMHHGECADLLRRKLDALIASVPDADLNLAVRYCSVIQIAWGSMGAASQDKLKRMVGRSLDVPTLVDATQVPALMDALRLGPMDDASMVAIAAATTLPDFLDRLVERFTASESFDTFKILREAFRNEELASKWTNVQLERLLTAIVHNAEFQKYWGYGTTVEELLRCCGDRALELEQSWRLAYDHLATRSDASSKVARDKIRSRFTSFPE